MDGFLFDGSSLTEGAAYLARLRDDRELSRQMGEQGRVKVKPNLKLACQFILTNVLVVEVNVFHSLGTVSSHACLRAVHDFLSCFLRRQFLGAAYRTSRSFRNQTLGRPAEIAAKVCACRGHAPGPSTAFFSSHVHAWTILHIRCLDVGGQRRLVRSIDEQGAF